MSYFDSATSAEFNDDLAIPTYDDIVDDEDRDDGFIGGGDDGGDDEGDDGGDDEGDDGGDDNDAADDVDPEAIFDQNKPVLELPPAQGINLEDEDVYEIEDDVYSVIDKQEEDGDFEGEYDDATAEEMKQLNQRVSHNYILSEHPECITHNMDEILAMVNVERDENGNVIDDLHKTLSWVTPYEKTRIIGARTKQLNSGNPPLIAVDAGLLDNDLIARREFEAKVIPMIIVRPQPNKKIEYWRLSDLEIL